MSEQPAYRDISVDNTDMQAQDQSCNRWAVIVGISKHKHSGLDLKYADRDAEKLYQLLIAPQSGQFSPDYILKLTNKEATKDNITRALRSFLKKPAREDLVIIYFACHGSTDPERPGNVYLIPYDTDPNDISGTALPMDDIDRALKDTLLSEKVIILADTCHSAAIGGGLRSREITKTTALINRYLEDVSAARGGTALLTSAESNEVSFEDKKWGGGHGVFTYYLLQGLQGAADIDRNGLVTVGELFEYVRENVKKTTDHRQHPSIGTNPFDRNMPLAIVNSTVETPAKKPKPLLEGLSPSFSPNRARPKIRIGYALSAAIAALLIGGVIIDHIGPSWILVPGPTGSSTIPDPEPPVTIPPTVSANLFSGDPIIQGQWSDIRQGHVLTVMHDGRVLDWVPEDGSWKLWDYDPRGTVDIFSDYPIAQGKWSRIQQGHVLTVMHDGRVLDWVPEDGSWRLWNYDPSKTTNILTGSPVAHNAWESIRQGHILKTMHDGRVLDWVPEDGSWRLWHYDPSNTVDIFPGYPIAQQEESSVQLAHTLLVMHDGQVLDWVPETGSWKLWPYYTR